MALETRCILYPDRSMTTSIARQTLPHMKTHPFDHCPVCETMLQVWPGPRPDSGLRRSPTPVFCETHSACPAHHLRCIEAHQSHHHHRSPPPITWDLFHISAPRRQSRMNMHWPLAVLRPTTPKRAQLHPQNRSSTRIQPQASISRPNRIQTTITMQVLPMKIGSTSRFRTLARLIKNPSMGIRQQCNFPGSLCPQAMPPAIMAISGDQAS